MQIPIAHLHFMAFSTLSRSTRKVVNTKQELMSAA